MKENPRDWVIADIEKVCRDIGLTIQPPSNGSHYKVSSEKVSEILTIPAKRPIKQVYVKQLVRLAETHIKKMIEEGSHE